MLIIAFNMLYWVGRFPVNSKGLKKQTLKKRDAVCYTKFSTVSYRDLFKRNFTSFISE